ncbi:MAG: hypothetical protein BWY54_00241 [Candidatus Dependentiae bacterium ADurb.Bin331]|nr:MAG: hypothetical protein BWY54_00241 [Candidatus Dependentiae bacterium ADurb.Bin331]
MKKLFVIALALTALTLLPECGRKKCCKQECSTVVAQNEKRVSGPLAEKEAGWSKEDYA